MPEQLFTTEDLARLGQLLQGSIDDQLDPILELAARLLPVRRAPGLLTGPAITLPCSPAALTTHELGQRTVYALACTDGKVVLGWVEPAGPTAPACRLQLGQFERRTDEPITLLFQAPLLSSQLTLYVIVRRWPHAGEPRPQVYRAVVSVANGALRIRPSRDDSGLTDEWTWDPLSLPVAQVPPWLLLSTLTAPREFDLLGTPPTEMPTWVDELKTELQRSHEELGQVICSWWDGRTLLMGTDRDRLWLREVKPGGKLASSLVLPGWVTCLGAETGLSSLIVGCQDRRLRGYRLENKDKESRLMSYMQGRRRRPLQLKRATDLPTSPSWELRLDSRPVALAPLHADSAWPDLLLATANDQLFRWRYTGDAPWEGWRQLQHRLEQHLGLSTLSGWLQWTSRRIPDRLHATARLRTLAASLLDRLEQTTTAEQKMIPDVAELLASPRLSPIHRDIAQELGHRILMLEQEGSTPEQEGSAAGAKLSLIRTVWAWAARVKDEEAVDRVLRELYRIGDAEQAQATPEYRQLIAYLAQQQLTIPADSAPEVEDPQLLTFQPWLRHFDQSFLTHGLAEVQQGEQRRLALLSRWELRLHEFPGVGGSLTAPLAIRPRGRSEEENQVQPVLRHVRSLSLGPGQAVAVLGGQAGQAGLLDFRGDLELHGAWSDATCQASALLSAASPQEFTFALAWIRGRQSFLELLRAHWNSGHWNLDRIETESWQPLPLPRVADLDARTLEVGRFLVAAGDELTDELCIWELVLGQPLRLQQQLKLDRSITALRWVGPPTAPALVVGTRSGMVWCLDPDQLRLRWAYRARHAVRSLDVWEGSGGAWQVVVAAEPDTVLVLDQDGRVCWRVHATGQVRAVRWLHSAPAALPQLALVKRHGGLVLLRQVQDVAPNPPSPTILEEIAERLGQEPVTPAEELQIVRQMPAGAAIRSDLLRHLRSPQARRAWCIRLLRAAAEANVAPSMVLGPASFRDLLDIAEGLSPGLALQWAPALLDAILARPVMETTGPDSARGRRVALAMVQHHLANLAIDPRQFTERLRRLPSDSLDDEWVAAEAARGWLQTLEQPPAQLPAERLERMLGDLHRVPPRLLSHFGTVIRPVEAARMMVGLARLTLELDQASGLGIDLKTLAEASAPVLTWGGLPSALGLLVLFLAHPGQDPEARWAEWQALLEASRAIPEVPRGPVRELCGRLAHRCPPETPRANWPQRRQLAWLRGALEQLPQSPSKDPTGDPAWQPLWSWLATLLDEATADLLLQRLTLTEALARPLLRLDRWHRPRRDRLAVRLALVPDGSRAIHGAQLAVTWDDPGGPPEPLHVCERHLWQAGEPEDAFELTLPWPADRSELRLIVDTFALDQLPHRGVWTFAIPTVTVALEPGSSLVQGLNQHRLALARQLRQLTGGVTLVAIDSSVGAEELATELLQGGPGQRVLPDQLLAKVGPGRLYPAHLTPDNVVRALRGLAPVIEGPEMVIEPTRLGGAGVAWLLLFPGQDTLERLLTPELAELHTFAAELLQDHARQRRSPALIWFVSDQLAARARRWLGADVRILHAHQLPVPHGLRGSVSELPEQTEAVAELSRQLACTPVDAHREWERACWDTRILAERLSRRRRSTALSETDPPLIRVATTDLAALRSEELARLLVTHATKTAIPLAKVRAGMLSAVTIQSTVRSGSSPPKVLVSPGEVLDAATLGRIRSDGDPPTRLSVLGVLPAFPARQEVVDRELAELLPPPEDLYRQLAADGFLTEAAGTYQVAPLYAQALTELRRQGLTLEQLFQRCTNEGGVLDGVALVRLAGASEALTRLLTGQTDPTRRTLLRTVGRLWSIKASLPRGELSALVGQLTGLAEVRVLQEADGLPPLDPLLAELVDPRQVAFAEARRSAASQPERYLFAFLTRTAHADHSQLGPWLAQRPTVGDPSALVLLGPGVEGWPPPQVRTRLAVLREADLRRILRAASSRAEFWAWLRHHVGLTMESPFTDSLTLPPGSPLFVGRSRIREEVRQQLAARSFLILGPRQIGKTSLLNQLIFDARQRSEFVVLRLEGQGISHGAELRGELLEELARCEPITDWPAVATALTVRVASVAQPGTALVVDLLRRFALQVRARQQIPVVGLNEIDGLLRHDRPFIERLRGLAEQEGVNLRLLLVGYATASFELDDQHSPLVHLTAGEAGQRVFNLAMLSREEGLELVDKLEAPPLGLGWETPEQRRQGRELLLDRSYCIPWLLQQQCSFLVRRMQGQRRWLLRVDDVRQVAESAELLVRLDRLELERLLRRPEEQIDEALRQACRLVLAALVYDRYFTGRVAIEDPQLMHEDPVRYAFTADEAAAIVERLVRQLCIPGEQARVLRFLAGFSYQQFLRGLCLTIILAVAPQPPERFLFQNHIYPRELARIRTRGNSPLDRLVDALVALHRSLPEVQRESVPNDTP